MLKKVYFNIQIIHLTKFLQNILCIKAINRLLGQNHLIFPLRCKSFKEFAPQVKERLRPFILNAFIRHLLECVLLIYISK